MCKRKKLKIFRVKQDLTQEELAKNLAFQLLIMEQLNGVRMTPSYKMMSNFFRLYPQEKFEIFDKEEEHVNKKPHISNNFSSSRDRHAFGDG
ncbi:hypothetical protein X813_gp22 [Lactobacillus phage LL-Ku]|uniref:Uncharacterized protein n=1 Tax=Lactobacillus phage LL-Ku TaxID=2892343 RepID=F7V9C2_9CAUD|nr:hypothetical protein X813_gp22 [Lactobacillus phage LL-Ku]AAV30183.1 hypothetical protein [Lactobacillus phage LL-Ku]